MATAALPDMRAVPAQATAAASPSASPAADKQAESPRTDDESGGESSSVASSPSAASKPTIDTLAAGKADSGAADAVAAPGTPPSAADSASNTSSDAAKPVHPPPLELVHHDIDDEASDSEEEEEDEDEEVKALNGKAQPATAAAMTDEDEDSEEDGEVIDGADLGTPLAYASGGADFGEDDEFATHQFYGPSIPGDDTSARVLHALRRVHIHDKPPRFYSEPPSAADGHVHSNSNCSTVGSSDSVYGASLSRRTSSNASGFSSSTDSRPAALSRAHSEVDHGHHTHQPHTFSVTFDEPVVGFQTNVVVSLENEVVVEVGNVERDSPAHRAGVQPGDWLISVNGQKLESKMTRDEVLSIVQNASRPRVLVFEREAMAAHEHHDQRHDSDGTVHETRGQSKSAEKKAVSKQLMGRLSSAVSYGSSIIGSKWKRKKPVVHPDSFCDGCGMDPIVGALWTCSVCSSFNLCSECYEMGTHGLENSEQMQLLSEALVQYKLQKKCKQFTPEFLLSLRRDICKGRPDKFEYMGGWIAEIVNGTAPSKITVRGIEVPSLLPSARQRFVTKLMGLVSNRRDIEVNIEWLPDDSAPRASCMHPDEPLDEGEGFEKLRIWISDKKTRTTSPFA